MPRKTRVDPAQEYLLQKKDKVNQEISTLISLWIDLKRAMNGYPAPGIGVSERNDIKFPLPGEIDQAQDRVRTLVDSILNQIDDVQKQQESYSRTRRVSRKEKAQHPVSVAPKTEEVDKGWEGGLKTPENVPGLASSNFVLVKEASTSFSRMMSHIFQAFNFKDKDRWLRLRMLRSSADIEDSLIDIEDLLLSKEPNSIPKAVYTAKNAYYLIGNSLIDKLGQYIDSAIAVVDNTVKELENKADGYEEVTNEDIISEQPKTEENKLDVATQAKHNLETSSEYLIKLQPFAMYPEPNPVLAKQLAEINNMISASMILLKTDPYQALANSKKIADDLSIAALSLVNQKPKTEAGVEYELYCYSSNQLTRTLKRYWMEIFGGKDKNLRIEAATYIRNSRQSLNKTMDILEQANTDMGQVIESVYEMINSFKSALLKIVELAEIHNSLVKIERGNTRLEGKRFKLDIISETDKNKLIRVVNDMNERFLSKMAEYKKKSDELTAKLNVGE